MTRSDPGHRFLALDGMRAVCAYMVLLHHHGPDIPALQHPFVLAFLGQLNLGVTPFFVLSGFVITYHYFELPSNGFWPYAVRRIARIVPLYFLLTTLVFVIAIAHGTTTDAPFLTSYIMNITMLKGWFDDLKFSGIVQGWSLTTEMVFYMAAPLIFLFIRKRGWGWVVLLPILCISIGLMLVAFVGDEAPLGFMRSNFFLFGITFLGRSPDFFAGVGLAMIFRKYGNAFQTRSATWIGATIILSCLLIMAHWKLGYEDAAGVLIANLLLPVFGVAVLFWGLLTEASALRRLLASKLFQVLGRSSYAFYLIHLGIFYSLFYDFTESFVLTVIGVQTLAWLLYTGIESPCVQFAKRHWPFGRKDALVP